MSIETSIPLEDAIQHHHAHRPEQTLLQELDRDKSAAFRDWAFTLHRLYAERYRQRPRHSSMNTPPLGCEPTRPDAADALATARRYARRMVKRYDDEVESAVNDAVMIALGKWAPDGDATFETFLYRCVLNCFRSWVRDHARRTRRETSEIDHGMEYVR